MYRWTCCWPLVSCMYCSAALTDNARRQSLIEQEIHVLILCSLCAKTERMFYKYWEMPWWVFFLSPLLYCCRMHTFLSVCNKYLISSLLMSAGVSQQRKYIPVHIPLKKTWCNVFWSPLRLPILAKTCDSEYLASHRGTSALIYKMHVVFEIDFDPKI
jgi:hypothetical protein